MLFNSYGFVLFFVATLTAYRTLSPTHRNTLLLSASLIFYFLWIPQYLILLLLDAGINYALLRTMVRGRQPRTSMIASVVVSLTVLAYYKYAAFVLSSLNPMLQRFSGTELQVPEILLPLGISFFTFQMMALTIDTYRGQAEPVTSFREYLLFISFFPQLIAGPILRGWQFLPQLRRGGRPTRERSRRAAWLIASGIAKKILLADTLLAPFVDRVFQFPGYASAPMHLVAMYSFAFQIYCDFSGYTDIARGLGLLLGFELPKNFTEPYLSRSPTEFWRRWHITLSRWLRDYLYIPLGGNRRGKVRTDANLLITMLLGGLWHGAGWTFVIWGGVHGVLLMVQRLFRRGSVEEDAPLRLRDVPNILVMFTVAAALFVVFRAPTLGDALAFLERLLTGSYRAPWPVLQTSIVALCMVLHGLERAVRFRLPVIRARLDGAWGGAAEGLALGAIAGLAAIFGGGGAEFIYFQF
jgi:alginate O-acetyltransferase complex protein AlgI